MYTSSKRQEQHDNFHVDLHKNDPHYIVKCIEHLSEIGKIKSIESIDVESNRSFIIYNVKDHILPTKINKKTNLGFKVQTRVVKVAPEFAITQYVIITINNGRESNLLDNVFIPNPIHPHVNKDYSYCLPPNIYRKPFTIYNFITLRESMKLWNMEDCYRKPQNEHFTAVGVW